MSSETIAAADSSITMLGEQVRLLYFRKPAEQLYQVILSSMSFTPEELAQVHLYLYQTDGTVQQLSVAKQLETDPDVLSKLKQVLVTIDFKKTTTSTINFESLTKTEEELKMLELTTASTKAAADFKSGTMSFYLYYKLTLLIDFLRQQPAYFYLLDRFKEFHQL